MNVKIENVCIRNPNQIENDKSISSTVYNYISIKIDKKK